MPTPAKTDLLTALRECVALSEKATEDWRVVPGMEWLIERPDGWTVGDFERGDEDSPISEAEANASAALAAALRNLLADHGPALLAAVEAEKRAREIMTDALAAITYDSEQQAEMGSYGLPITVATAMHYWLAAGKDKP